MSARRRGEMSQAEVERVFLEFAETRAERDVARVLARAMTRNGRGRRPFPRRGQKQPSIPLATPD